MITALASLALSTAVSCLLTPLVRSVALRRGLLDGVTDSRKIHVGRIPRLGGIAIVLAFYTTLTAVVLSRSGGGALIKGDHQQSTPVLVGGILIALLGFYDDLRGAGAKTKFAVQFAIAGALYGFGFRIDHVATPLGAFWLGPLAMPVTLLWIVGVTNAVNLIDGLDGLAGGVAFIALSTLFAISLLRPEPLMMLVAATLGGSVLGFLFYNFNPASIFMGDCGSMFLGFMIATTSIRASQESSTAVAIMIPIVLLALPIADTILALLRRARRRRGLFTGDREHIHHRLVSSGLSQRQAVIALYALSLLCGLAALTLFIAQSRIAVAAVCLALALNTSLLLTRLRRRPEPGARDSALSFTPAARAAFEHPTRQATTGSGSNGSGIPVTYVRDPTGASSRRRI